MFEKMVHAYKSQRRVARFRSIEWLFTLEEWLAWWRTDDRWSRRGRGRDALCMARRHDTGPYCPENVYCVTQRENAKDVPASTWRKVVEGRRLTKAGKRNGTVWVDEHGRRHRTRVPDRVNRNG